MANVFDREKLLKLAAWAQLGPQKKAFVDPSGGMPPGGAPPMDPATGMDPAAMGGMPMDPNAMGGMPPMGAGMPAGDPMPAAPPGAAPPPPPADPSAQAMGDQEMIRGIIRDEIQKALGGGEGGVTSGGVKKSGNKFEDALRVLEDKMKEQSKIFVAALRNAGIEIPLADLYGIDKADGSGAPAGAPTAAQSQPGVSETLQTGLGGDAAGSQPGKIASAGLLEDQIARLTKLAQVKDQLNRSALAPKLTPYDPQQEDLSYLAVLFR